MFARSEENEFVQDSWRGEKKRWDLKRNAEILVFVCVVWMLDSRGAVIFSVQRCGNSAFVLQPSSAQPLPLRR